MPASQIEAALNPIAYRCACVLCSQAVTARIQAVLQEWAAIKVRVALVCYSPSELSACWQRTI